MTLSVAFLAALLKISWMNLAAAFSQIPSPDYPPPDQENPEDSKSCSAVDTRMVIIALGCVAVLGVVASVLIAVICVRSRRMLQSRIKELQEQLRARNMDNPNSDREAGQEEVPYHFYHEVQDVPASQSTENPPEAYLPLVGDYLTPMSPPSIKKGRKKTRHVTPTYENRPSSGKRGRKAHRKPPRPNEGRQSTSDGYMVPVPVNAETNV